MASDAADDPVPTNGGGGVTTWVGLAVAGLGYYFGLKPSGIWATAPGAMLAAIGGVVLFGWGLLIRHYTRALRDARDQRRSTERLKMNARFAVPMTGKTK
jgi:hypothetical protein